MSTTQKTIKLWQKVTARPAALTTTSAHVHSSNIAPHATSYVTVKSYPQRSVRDILERRPKWKDREYRESYMEASIEQGIAWQIRINREIRDMKQSDLARAIDTGQSAISRLEDPSYGSHSLETLVKVAHAFDCALSVKFVSYSQLAYDSERLGEGEQYAASYTDEMKELNNEHSHYFQA